MLESPPRCKGKSLTPWNRDTEQKVVASRRKSWRRKGDVCLAAVAVNYFFKKNSS
jgi:hypothetical protein